MFSKTAHGRNMAKAFGAIVLCLAILGAFSVVLGGFRFWETLDVYNLRFRSVKDLSAGRPVKYGGLDVGRILSIGVDGEDPRLIRVVIGLSSPVPIREGVVARIAQKGLVGDYYVFLDPQGTLGEVLPPGSFIKTMETVDIAQLAGMAGEILSELRPRLERIAEHIEDVLSNENAANIKELMEKAPKLVEELNTTAMQVRSDFSTFATSGKGTAEQATKALKTFDETMRSIQVEVDKTLASMRGEIHAVGDLTSTVHKAVAHDQAQVEDILANIERMSEDLKQLSSRLRERPWELLQKPQEGKK
ncbi:MlaD family protein [Fundidesulfovibrio agrisoli]|uniref:MlaD family protein n=1 Tax=Fundidesulfovibrio agrisoli TaxID=2922717 RepID=UPI001FABB994